MKKFVQSSCVIASVLLLGGCYVNKNGYICSLTLPEAYCDKEVYERLTNPGKMIDDWNLPGKTEQGRLQDWVACGGSSGGQYGLVPLPNGEARTTEQSNKEAGEKFDSIQRCMLKKDYEYIGQCYDNEVSRSLPACRARAGEPWE